MDGLIIVTFSTWVLLLAVHDLFQKIGSGNVTKQSCEDRYLAVGS